MSAVALLSAILVQGLFPAPPTAPVLRTPPFIINPGNVPNVPHCCCWSRWFRKRQFLRITYKGFSSHLSHPIHPSLQHNAVRIHCDHLPGAGDTGTTANPFVPIRTRSGMSSHRFTLLTCWVLMACSVENAELLYLESSLELASPSRT